MPDPDKEPRGRFTPTVLLGLVLLAGGLTLAYLTGVNVGWLSALSTILLTSSSAAAVITGAGGYGWAAIGRWMPVSVPSAFRVATACGVGLWMLSTGILIVGSLTHGLLTPWLWWPVVGLGLVLAAWFARRKRHTPFAAERSDARALLWVVVAIAGMILLAGASMPPGAVGGTERYDVLEYHLQAPREYYLAQHIQPLEHNVYSYFPSGVEMLYLLAMALRGGAYEGVYLAKFMHAAFYALSILAVFGALRRDDEPAARFATGLLATTPLLIYLGFLAMVELAEVFYLLLAVFWLRRWLADCSLPSALCVGMAVGAACAVKYLSVGFVAGPVLLAMVLVGLKRLRAIWHVVPVGLVALLLFSPWLLRNAISSHNPIFPLGTTLFGRGHWSAECQQRWIHGHAPGQHPPVPEPPGYEPEPAQTRLQRFVDNFLKNPYFGHIMMVVAALGICAWVARRGPTDLFGGALIAILAVQLFVWIAFTHEMPWRFVVPAAVPMVLLAAGALAALSRVRTNPFNPGASPPPHGRWGLPPATFVFAVAVIINLLLGAGLYKAATFYLPLQGVSYQWFVEKWWPPSKPAYELGEDARLMLVGEARGFYFPPGTVYATVFDEHPLARWVEEGLTRRQILRRLRERGITHVWVSWDEIDRLARSYGFPAALRSDLLERREAGGPIGNDLFDRLDLPVHKHLYPPEPTTAPAEEATTAAGATTQPTTKPATRPAESDLPRDRPFATIYSVPPPAGA